MLGAFTCFFDRPSVAQVGPEGVVRAVKQFVEEREAARREAAAAEDPFGAEGTVTPWSVRLLACVLWDARVFVCGYCLLWFEQLLEAVVVEPALLLLLQVLARDKPRRP